MSTASLLRWLRWGFGLAAILLVVIVAVKTTRWSGRKTLPVEVQVIDTDLLQPVADAEVTLFVGPSTPLEGSLSAFKPADFEPSAESQDSQTAVTDSAGRAKFDYPFWASGSSGLWADSGYVDTSNVWLRVRAAGRTTALIPLDRQSTRPRDIHDLSPIVVTVVLNRTPDGD